MRYKKAAMEMSMGTIVTIILLVVVLVLGIFFVQKIFGTGTSAIDSIDTQVQSEINKLFAREGKKVVIYPPSGEISLKKGDSGGFGFSIRNNEIGGGDVSFSYAVSAIENNCQLSNAEATSYIILGRTGQGFNLGSGDSLEQAILVKMSIPEEAPLCMIRYLLDVKKQGSSYVSGGITMDLEIK